MTDSHRFDGLYASAPRVSLSYDAGLSFNGVLISRARCEATTQPAHNKNGERMDAAIRAWQRHMDSAAPCVIGPANTVTPAILRSARSRTVANKVEAAYHRTDLLEQRRPLMEAWAKHVFGE